jgi:predicted dehydrogenase
MRSARIRLVLFCSLAAFCLAFGALSAAPQAARGKAMKEIRFMTLDPGHFHAGLVQKEMYPNVSPKVHIYAPVGTDLLEHLGRITAFNIRKENPTSWQLEIHTGPDFLERMLKEKPGNVVVLSGRNAGKIDRIRTSVDNGLNVLADKPWIIEAADFPKLEAALNVADQKKVIAYDIMTERFEVTSILQKELVGDRDTFGTLVPGTATEPALYMKSVHNLLKMVAGMPNRRPAWFFDTKQQGEALGDVATHVVDLTQWMLLPGQPVDYRRDIRLVSAKRWATPVSQAQFRTLTGEADFPSYLAANVSDGKLQYFCNGQVTYQLRGTFVTLDLLWNYEPPAGAGDTHDAYVRGTRSKVEIRQGPAEKFRTEVYVTPNNASERSAVGTALARKIQALQKDWPGVAVRDAGPGFRLDIPDKYRVGHEAHFGQVTASFLKYVEDPAQLPAWEKPNMLAKYYVATQAVQMSRK